MSVELPDSFMEMLAEHVAPLVAGLLASSPAVDPDHWIGVQLAAEHLGCKRQRIYDLVGQKDSGIPYRKEGARLLFKRSQLDAWLDRGARR